MTGAARPGGTAVLNTAPACNVAATHGRRDLVATGPHDRPRDLSALVSPWLERADQLVYALVALLLLGAAVAMGVYSVGTFSKHLGDDFPHTLVALINNLLLVLIILEVLSTVRHHMATGTTSLEPFLYIGIVSATRQILAVGAEAVLGESTTEAAFRHLMIDLGVNGAVVLALAAALYLLWHARPAADHAERAGGT